MIISPLKVWVQNILPVVYDDSLSYLEIVAKINAKTNEIISQTNENTHAIETLASVISDLGDIDELKELLDEVKTIVEDLYTTDAPMMDGEASAGSADHAARSDHVHPSDTNKANKDLDINNSTVNQYVKILAVDDDGKPTAFGSDTPSGGGTSDYDDLENQPQINNVTLIGNLSSDDIGLLGTEALTPYRTATAQDAIDANLMALGLTGASTGDLVRVNAIDANGKPTSWKHVPLCEIKTNPNLTDNWDFTNPVNQRGQTTWQNAGEYTVDRWKLTSGTASLGAPGMTLNGTLVQILETAVGQPVTCSALLSNNTMITPTYDDTTKTFTITATGQTIVAVKMELGTEQTLAHQENGVWVLNEIANYGEELAECQRYYYKAQRCLFLRSGSTNSWVILTGFKVTMRNPPSFQLINSYGIIPGVSAQVVPTILSTSTPYVSEDGFGDIDMTVSPDGALFCTDATFSADL